jgi:tRNA/rRNA methyltransferase
MLAHASGDVLESAEVFDGLKQAICDMDITVATTAKTRDARVEYIDGSLLPDLLRSKGQAVKRIGLVFGREESGLTNEEIRMCDMVSSIPMKVSYPSLNLGQSVMIYAYLMASATLADHPVANPSTDQEGFRAMMDKSERLLKELGIDNHPALYHRILERLASLGEDDIHLVHSILNRLLK